LKIFCNFKTVCFGQNDLKEKMIQVIEGLAAFVQNTEAFVESFKFQYPASKWMKAQ